MIYWLTMVSFWIEILLQTSEGKHSSRDCGNTESMSLDHETSVTPWIPDDIMIRTMLITREIMGPQSAYSGLLRIEARYPPTTLPCVDLVQKLESAHVIDAWIH